MSVIALHGRSERLHLLDLLKLLFVMTIVIFHSWETLIYVDDVTTVDVTAMYPFYAFLTAHIFNYGGILLAALSFFLFGRNNSRLSFFKFLAIVIAVFGLEIFIDQTWDIFSFILLSLILCLVLLRSLKMDLFFLTLSFCGLLIPQQIYVSLIEWPARIINIFVMNVNTPDTPNGWFLLPWIFIPMGFYSAGRLSQTHKLSIDKFLTSKLFPLAVFALIAIDITLFFLQDPSLPVMLGPNFYKFLFWQSTTHFWQHLIPFIIFLMVAIHPKVIEKLKNSPLKTLSKLQWIKNLWLCYILQFCLILFIQDYFLEEVHMNFYVIDWLWIVVFIGTELIAQAYFKFLKHMNNFHQKRRGDKV